MPLFKCTGCGCVENTALSGYWGQQLDCADAEGHVTGFEPKCSDCNPEIGQWHDRFPKRGVTGYKLGADGFLYKPEEMIGSNRFTHTTIVGDA